MKKIFTILFLFSFSYWADAQQYEWVRGGGSSDPINNGGVQGEFIKAICTDDNRNVYILAQVGVNNIKADTFEQTAQHPFITWHILFASYDCNGKMRFAKLLESKGTNDAHGIVYSQGKIYISGTLYDLGKRVGYDATFSSQYQSAFIAKYDTSGQYDWLKFIGPDNPSTFQTSSANGPLAKDAQGNIHYFLHMGKGVQITPNVTSNIAGTYDIKYDINGNILSVNLIPSRDSIYFVARAQQDPQTGDWIVLQKQALSSTKAPSVLSRYTSSWAILWQDTTKLRNGLANFRLADGFIYLAGACSGTYPFTYGNITVQNGNYATGAMSIMAKVDMADGKPVWIKHFDGKTGVNGFGDIEVLPNNQLAAYGTYNGVTKYGSDSITSPLGGNVFPHLAIIDTSGKLIKLQGLTSGPQDKNGRSLGRDSYGNLYLTGDVVNTIAPSPSVSYTSGGAIQIFT